MYGDSHVTDKTIVRPSYLKHGDRYTGKTAYLYWDGPQYFSGHGNQVWYRIGVIFVMQIKGLLVIDGLAVRHF